MPKKIKRNGREIDHAEELERKTYASWREEALTVTWMMIDAP